jgi:hypothetical protein
MAECASSLDIDAHRYVTLIIRKLLATFYFQHTMGTKIAIWEIPLKTKDFSSIRLPIQDTTYCNAYGGDYRRSWIDNCVHWITVYTLQFTTVHFTVFPRPSLFSPGPRTSCGPNYQLTLCRLVSELYNLRTDRRENNSSHYWLSSRYQVTSFAASEQTYSVHVTISSYMFQIEFIIHRILQPLRDTEVTISLNMKRYRKAIKFILRCHT